MANSADPDQLASSDLVLHCLQNRVYPGSAGEGLRVILSSYLTKHQCLRVNFVCVEVLWPSQPIGVMFSAVNSPKHSFSGQP